MKQLKQVFILLFFSVYIQEIHSQDLVDNGDFESYLTLPLNYGDFCVVSGWINPSGCCVLNPNFGTPDYVHKNAAWPVGVPSNGFGTITPHSGNGAVGFTTYANYGTPPVFREYLTKKLNSHMVIGQSYTISFYIARAGNPYFRYATSNIGVYFSNAQPIQSGTSVIPVTPQWEHTTVFSSSSWTLMSFTVVPTDTFNYMTIGNFRSDAATLISTINPSAGGLYSHYFIDDVSVLPSNPLAVEWLSFDVLKEHNRVGLTWKTAAEENNDYFSVERSRDMLSFDIIDIIKGEHNSSAIKSYYSKDENPFPGNNYYRIRQTDLNGNCSFSEIKGINMQIVSASYEAWFDKYREVVHLDILLNEGSNTLVYLMDVNGRKCFQWSLSGQKSADFPVGFLRKGIYILIVRDGKNGFEKKLFINGD